MDSSTHIDEVTNSIRHIVQQKLRSSYPFMKPEALQRTLDNITKSVEKDVGLAQPAMEEAKSQISFFSLPAEIRDHIYALLLKKQRPQRIDFWRGRCGAIRIRERPFCQSGIDNGLAWASLQVRAEARAVYYSQNAFEIYANGEVDLSSKLAWVTRVMERVILPQGRLFRRLCIFFPSVSTIELVNGIWLNYHGESRFRQSSVCCGPIPLLTQEMVLSVFDIETTRLTRAVITVACNSRKNCREEIAVLDMATITAE